MKEGKHTRKSFKIIEVYSVLILVATLFMSIGYAEIIGTQMTIEGTVKAEAQEGVFIKEINSTSSDVNTDIENSSIDYYKDTTLRSTVVLGKESDSYITYQVSIYNNSNYEQLFIKTLTDKTVSSQYSNTNINYTIGGLEEYKTTIAPNGELNFTLTFNYVSGADITQNTLTSILNFRFLEKPTLVLSNENEKYTLDNIYPDYTTKEFEFSVLNYKENKINAVPMQYSFETIVDKPLNAKIYDENGKEVTGNITIDGSIKVEHKYKLKIIWDSTNTENNKIYNDTTYAGIDFSGIVKLNAVANGENKDKYLEYKIAKQFSVEINSAPLCFNPNIQSADIVIKNNIANLSMTINNYNSDTEYSPFNMNYEISIENNTKFTYTVNGDNPVNNIVSKTINGGSKTQENINIQFTADMKKLDLKENLTVKITLKSPYVKEIKQTINIKIHEVKVTLNANGGNVNPTTITVYQSRTYSDLPTPTRTGHSFNGWYTAATGGTKYENTTEVTTGESTQTLYAQWTSYLLADKVSMGDYVNYPVNYTNVATYINNGTYAAASTYVGWRVLDVQGSGDNRYVRIIPAGVPITYRHIASTNATAATSVSNLTNNFFGIPFSTSTSEYAFYSSGFKTAAGGTVNTQAALKSLFTNDYTQISSGVPAVRSLTVNDIEATLQIETYNSMPIKGYDNLFAVPSSNPSTGYAGYYLAEANGVYLWAVYREGSIVYTYAVQGVRPVVSLKVGLETTGQVNGVWQLP